MRVINSRQRTPDASIIAKLNQALSGVDDITFDNIRAADVVFSNMADGEIHQLAIDAGYKVED
tara:strand:+ start:115 stop:303 length:189 start_codon:yes stop_codon:yes gene_type:complete